MGKKRRTSMPRRRFLIQMALGTGFVASGLSACTTAANFRTRLAEGRVVLPRAALDEKLRADDVVLVTAEGLPESIILIRLEEDAYRALGSRCTHLGCEVRPRKACLKLSLPRIGVRPGGEGHSGAGAKSVVQIRGGS